MWVCIIQANGFKTGHTTVGKLSLESLAEINTGVQNLTLTFCKESINNLINV